MFTVKLRRQMPVQPRVPTKYQLGHIQRVALRGPRGTSQGWKVTRCEKDEDKTESAWTGTATLYFKKTKGSQAAADAQWARIKRFIEKAGQSKSFNKYAWRLVDEEGKLLPQGSNGQPEVPAETE